MEYLKSYFGIDFGTTNSATTSIIEGARITHYGDNYGNPYPSLLAIDKITGQTYCGREAWERRKELSEACEIISSVKTYLGTDKIWNVAGKQWSPAMVASQIILGLKKQVKLKNNLNLEEAVISIPVGFTPEKRRALRKAAEMAGVRVKSFVSEPTSAFFKNYNDLKKYSKIAVFDWGGGTLDISIIENKNGKINELSVLGENLGGDEIDLKIAQWAHCQIMKQSNLNIGFEEMPPNLQDIMIVKSELAKKELSEADNTVIAIGMYGKFGPVRVVLDIDTFTKLIEPEVNRAISCLEEAVINAGLSFTELECILMVGGSSNLRPLIKKIEEQWKGTYIEYPDESEWCVAEGAARLSINPGKLRLNQDIGLILSDNSFFPLRNKNEFVSNEQSSYTFGIVEDACDARFVFTDGEKKLENQTRNIIGCLSVPTYGFLDEDLQLKSFIDKDLIFNVEVKSTRRPEEFIRTWRYPKLKFYYQLPELSGDKNE